MPGGKTFGWADENIGNAVFDLDKFTPRTCRAAFYRSTLLRLDSHVGGGLRPKKFFHTTYMLSRDVLWEEQYPFTTLDVKMLVTFSPC